MPKIKLDLLAPFENIPFFTIAGFRQWANDDSVGGQRSRELLSRWQRQGHIIQLKRGVYMARRFYELHRGEEGFAPAVSAILIPQSYLSLEYILQRLNILTEVTYPVTAVTLKNTRTFDNPLGVFVYRHIRPALYRGFEPGEYFGVRFYRASPAKALFDYLYFRPLPRRARLSRWDLVDDLRLNLDDFLPESRKEFAGYVEASASEKMTDVLSNLWRTVWRP